MRYNLRNLHILTHSGVEVSAHGGSPTIEDVGLALSRIPRFGGHTRQWWTVLDHSFVVAEMARGLGVWADKLEDGARLRLHALLHDAHECLTGDVPTPFKVPGIRSIQRGMDMRLYATLVPEDADMLLHDEATLHKIDRRALLAEAFVVGPPALRTIEGMMEHFGDVPAEGDVAMIERGIGHGDWGGYPMDLALGVRNPQVMRFINEYHILRAMMRNTA